jgi:hypothetical protein
LIIYFAGATEGWASIYTTLPIIATLAAFLVLLRPVERDTASLFTAGLFAGAVFAFFMSLGPILTFRHSGFETDNLLFLWCYEHFSALQGFRVVSRFSIFVLLFMVIAAALAWSRIEHRWLRRPALRWLWIVPLLLAVLESVPDQHPRIRPVGYPLSTPVLERLDRLKQPVVIAMVPMGAREYDSRYMLQIARTDRLFVYAWGGAYPRYTEQVRDALRPLHPAPMQASTLLRQLWPECFILEDKAFSRADNPEWLTPQFRSFWCFCNYAEVLSGETEILAEDDRFVLMRLKPEPNPSPEQIRMVRQDLLQANPHLTFRARTPAGAPPATLWLDVNGYLLGRWTLTSEPQSFEVDIPPRYFLPILPNRFRFHATDDANFFLDAFEPGPAVAGASLSVNDEQLESDCQPWLGHIHRVPESALPLDIRYRNGFDILACEPIATTAAPGGTIRLRHYVQCPRDMQLAVNLSVCSRLRAPDGTWIEEGISLADGGDLNDVRCQIHPAIYALDQTLSIPERLAPGNYELILLLRDEKDRRIRGKQNGKSGKLFPVPIPIHIVATQAPAGP